jgi:hypothetical protein
VGAGFVRPGFAAEPDAGRADAVLPVVRLLLGLDTAGQVRDDNDLLEMDG